MRRRATLINEINSGFLGGSNRCRIYLRCGEFQLEVLLFKCQKLAEVYIVVACASNITSLIGQWQMNPQTTQGSGCNCTALWTCMTKFGKSFL